MSFHEEFVYPDQTSSKRNARLGLAIYVIVLAALHFWRAVTGNDWFGQLGWYWWALEAGVLAALVWLVAGRKQKPQIVVSGRGLSGEWVEQRLGRMLKWHRIEKVRMEPGVIVVDFEPFDSPEERPRERMSQLRLPGNRDLSEEKLAEVISDYMPVEAVSRAA